MPTPTPTEKRLDRLERATAQLAVALRQTVGWRPHQHGQQELAEIVTEQQALAVAELEQRPHIAAEQRAA